ncbi:amidohydrolase [Halogeometricum sp. S1BR25-6]|uniref:Amidohydrolase n=1 Tax=Halogeometricum salsisoli TaxID=2950536 RepID=A0ABU2GFI1_9EURY|nr:amidohydrolase [Halogeometricum sp. S1BR25-6]MDS0299552.1 amidohydrolase [Halogeometricum sp. S1BR25-6]
MTDAADLVLLDGEIHTLCDPDETHEAIAVRDGRIVRIGATYDVEFLVGTETETLRLDGDVVLPGFVDAHTHLDMVGRSLVHADLSGASGPDDCRDRLRKRLDELESEGGAESDDWVLGFGYDESGWAESRYLTCEDLDSVATDRPVAAFREDMHVVSLNSVALDRHLGEMPKDDVRFDGEDPTGVVVEEAVDAIYGAVEPGVEETEELLRAAQAAANERGVTGVHDMTRNSQKPRVYRDLDRAGELTLRVRINYWADHLDGVIDAGLRTNHGSEMVRTGAIKTFTDGSFGGRTAKLSDPYSDSEGETGTWVVDPEELADVVSRADAYGLQLSAHAIGDEAVDAVLDAYETCESPGESRHRVEHAELADDEAIARFAESGVVASVQPNFLKWAEEGGLYASRLGDRRTETNRYAALADAGVPLAFGSDCMPLDPLLGVHWAVNAPAEAQRLSVTDALRAYTSGAAYAGFDEDRLGTLEVGKTADLTVLAESPWEAERIRDIDVSATVVDGRVVYDADA